MIWFHSHQISTSLRQHSWHPTPSGIPVIYTRPGLPNMEKTMQGITAMFPKYARIVGCLVSNLTLPLEFGLFMAFFRFTTTPRQSLRFHQHLRAWHGGRHRKTCLVDDTGKVSENRMEVIWRELLHFVPQTHTLVSSFVQWFSSLCSLDVSTRSLGTSPDALWRWLKSQIHKLVILSDSHTYSTNVVNVRWNFTSMSSTAV